MSAICNSVLLYSSSEASNDQEESLADPNCYTPFKTVDTLVTKRIAQELDALPDTDEEG